MDLTSRTIKIIYDKNIIIFDWVVVSFDVFLHSIICPHYIYIYCRYQIRPGVMCSFRPIRTGTDNAGITHIEHNVKKIYI